MGLVGGSISSITTNRTVMTKVLVDVQVCAALPYELIRDSLQPLE